MSRLGEAIKSYSTGRTAAKLPTVVSFSTEAMQESWTPPYVLECRAEARFRVTYYVNDTDSIKKVGERVKDAIINEIFGEFIDPIVQIQLALYGHDIDRALELVIDLRRRMFEI